MKNQVLVDFNQLIGEIKPMNAVCDGPRSGGKYLGRNVINEYKEMNIPCVRLHDIEGAYGKNQFVDIHCVFPNFDADENDELSYNFKQTDMYIKAILDSGSQVMFRLGESIDHYERKLYVRPPKDFYKWARICEHIIMHYNYGWAYGYYWNLKYWEIWNEPENDKMWTGTPNEFFELYEITAKHLKSRFPELEIGGYSASGLYSMFRDKNNPDIYVPWFSTLVPFMDKFFDYIKDKDIPLDFFSWHCYALTPNEIKLSADFMRNYLDQKGFKNTKSYLTEFNTIYSLYNSPVRHDEYMAELLASMIEADNCPLDMMYYYHVSLDSKMNGIIGWDIVWSKPIIYPAYNSMVVFGKLLALKGKVKVDYEQGQGLYALSAKDGKNALIALSNMGDDKELSIKAHGAEGMNAKISIFNPKGECIEKECKISNDGELLISLAKNHIASVQIDLD